ncbi:MAG: CCA tRNA nucleotidyltransferase [Beijerinckiaceae bacterium]
MSDAAARLLKDPDVRALLDALAEHGAEARIVGGAVRDAIMGRPPGDIDIASGMMPAAVMDVARSKGWKPVPTGVEHGTVTVVIHGRPFEVTTLRRDIETDGRRAVVAFTDDFREDAMRRDFTLNALSLGADGTIHDYSTGLADAKAGVIRFMGDARTRIREDYLRILRFFRFQASHGSGAPEPEGLAACAALKAGMVRLSRERVRQELVKLLVAPGAASCVEAMDRIGLWPHVLPDAAVDAAAFRRWAELEPLLPAGRDPMSALAALTGGKASGTALSESLRLSRAESGLLAAATMLGPLCVSAVTDASKLREAVYRTGVAEFPKVLLAACAVAGVSADDVAEAMRRAAAVLAAPPRLPFRSADAAALGVAAGPRMGLALKAAEERWIAAGLPENSAMAGQILRDAVAATPD